MKEIMQITGGRTMNKIGRFGEYGGQYVPEIVMNAVNELNEGIMKHTKMTQNS